jgi:hypothetical protein
MEVRMQTRKAASGAGFSAALCVVRLKVRIQSILHPFSLERLDIFLDISE